MQKHISNTCISYAGLLVFSRADRFFEQPALLVHWDFFLSFLHCSQGSFYRQPQSCRDILTFSSLVPLLFVVLSFIQNFNPHSISHFYQTFRYHCMIFCLINWILINFQGCIYFRKKKIVRKGFISHVTICFDTFFFR